MCDYNPDIFSPMLSEKYTEWKDDYTNYIASEKFDGFRSIYYNGEFRSRTCNKFRAPDWFSDSMPRDIVLDGELFVKRGDFKSVSSIVRKKVPIDNEWAQIKFIVFDTPCEKGVFQDCYEKLKNLLKTTQDEWSTDFKTVFATQYKYLYLAKQYKINNKEELMGMYDKIVKKGGEGVMIKDSRETYKRKRTKILLKIKPKGDNEAIVIGYKNGTGKYNGLLGSLDVQWISMPGDFSVGSGLTDNDRINYKTLFPIGTIVKVKYVELSSDNIPRHPVYIGTVPKEYNHTI
jgi:DNA ligase 1